MQDPPDPAATQITIGLLLLSAFAVLCMGWIPGAEDQQLHRFAYSGAAVLLACAVVAWIGQRTLQVVLIRGSLIASSLVVTVSVAALTSRTGDAFEVEIFYLLPLLLAAHFHETRFVTLSIAVAVLGHPVGLIIGFRPTAESGTELVSEALARSIPVGAVMASVTVLVHRMRLRDRSQRALLHGQATTDPLTQLMNRRGLAHAVDTGRAGAGSCSIVMVDLDHFKAINDAEGHAVGDRVLCATADALTAATTADTDVVVRFGGEEFLVLLPDRSIDAAAEFCDTVADALSRSTATASPVTASFGVTAWGVGEPIDIAIDRADDAVYDAKNAGRDRTHVRPAPQHAAPAPT